MSKWNLSEHGRLLTGRLHELRALKRWSGPSTRDEAIQSLLQQLADSCETAALPCVAQFLLATDEQTRTTARRITSRLLAGLSPYDLIQLSECFARQYDWYISEEWEKLGPFDLPLLTGASVESRCPAALGLLSFHRNGYIRHQAVRLLSEQADGTELPFLLLRQNDWVPPIAFDAQVAVAQRIGKPYVHHLAGSLHLILHLGTFRRHDHQDVIRKVIELLTWPEHGDILKAAVRNADREDRRQVVRHGLEIAGEHRERLISLALESDDSLIRLNACKYVAAAFAGSQLQTILDRLLSDAFMPVRREGLRIKTERFPDSANEVWQGALLDSSRSIRELARYSLAQCGLTERNIAAIYRDVLLETRRTLPTSGSCHSTTCRADECLQFVA